MVRLKVASQQGQICLLLRFNSNMVRLKDDRVAITLSAEKGFNSNMVRLKEGYRKIGYHYVVRFNSNMVRLKAEALFNKVASLGFQFQYGSIKRLALLRDLYDNARFQFQYGSIKSLKEII